MLMYLTKCIEAGLCSLRMSRMGGCAAPRLTLLLPKDSMLVAASILPLTAPASTHFLQHRYQCTGYPSLHKPTVLLSSHPEEGI